MKYLNVNLKKHLKYAGFSLAVVLILSSCSRKLKPDTALQTLKSTTVGTDTFTSATPENTLVLGKEVKQSLTAEQPVLKIGEYTSYTQKFHLNVEQGKKYNIAISSLCDCMGVRKYMIAPLATVKDSNGNKLSFSYGEQKYDYSGGPLTLNRNISFTADKSSDVEITVYADTEHAGQLMYTYIVTFVKAKVLAGVTGDFIIKATEM
jgi:hypothetical protein